MGREGRGGGREGGQPYLDDGAEDEHDEEDEGDEALEQVHDSLSVFYVPELRNGCAWDVVGSRVEERGYAWASGKYTVGWEDDLLAPVAFFILFLLSLWLCM